MQPNNGSPEPPPPPPRNHDPSFNDSKDSNEISEAECDRDQLINSKSYGGKLRFTKRAFKSFLVFNELINNRTRERESIYSNIINCDDEFT